MQHKSHYICDKMCYHNEAIKQTATKGEKIMSINLT